VASFKRKKYYGIFRLASVFLTIFVIVRWCYTPRLVESVFVHNIIEFEVTRLNDASVDLGEIKIEFSKGVMAIDGVELIDP